MSLIYGNIDMFALFYYESLFLPQKVATGTAYACLRPIEMPSSDAYARSQKVPGLRMFPYAIFCGNYARAVTKNINIAKKEPG